MKRKQITISEKQITIIKKLSDHQCISFSEMLRKIIDFYFESVMNEDKNSQK